MDIGHDLIGGLRDRILAAGTSPAAMHPDWAGLHACCVAAHAARGVLLLDQARQLPFARSFDRDIAQRLLAGLDSSWPVNPTNSGDSKHPEGKAVVIPGTQSSGDRGL